MILTAYFVFNATSVYTAGETHISDMWLEVLGNDVLKMMDTPLNKSVSVSPLRAIIENDDKDKFKTVFLNLTNNRTLTKPDNINFAADYMCRDLTDPYNKISEISLGDSRNLTGREHAVRVSKWVVVNKDLCGNISAVMSGRNVLCLSRC